MSQTGSGAMLFFPPCIQVQVPVLPVGRTNELFEGGSRKRAKKSVA